MLTSINSDLKGALDGLSAPELFDSSQKLKESEIEEKLAYCHVTAADVAKIRHQIKELEILSQKINDEKLRPDIEALQDRLANISAQCHDVIRQCQAKMAQLRDLTVFVRDELNWLKESQIAITGRFSKIYPGSKIPLSGKLIYRRFLTVSYAVRPLRRDCARLRDCRMSWKMSKCRAAIFGNKWKLEHLSNHIYLHSQFKNISAMIFSHGILEMVSKNF